MEVTPTVKPTAFTEQDFAFLPQFSAVLEVLRGDDVQEVCKQVTILKDQLQRAIDIVDQLPGIDLSRQQQKELFDKRQAELLRKSELLMKYRHLTVFENLSSPPPPTGESTNPMNLS